MNSTCKNGHVRTAENTYIWPKTGQPTHCLECSRTLKARQRSGLPNARSKYATQCINGHDYTPENTMIRPGREPGQVARACRQCSREHDLNRHYRDRDKRNAEANARYHALTEEQKRDMRLRRQYAMTIDDYYSMLKSQGGVCAICGSTEPVGRGNWFAVDHDRSCCPTDRTCGKCVRALLCSHCNLFIGNAKENPEILRAAIRYIETWRART